MPYHTIPYHTMPYHTIPYHTIPYHTIPYHTIPYHKIIYYTIVTENPNFHKNFLGYYPDVPSCPFDQKFDQFSFLSLLTRAEVIHAMTKVRAECNRVATMCLFQIPITKSMRLEEFEQTQSQASSQVSSGVFVVLVKQLIR